MELQEVARDEGRILPDMCGEDIDAGEVILYEARVIGNCSGASGRRPPGSGWDTVPILSPSHCSTAAMGTPTVFRNDPPATVCDCADPPTFDAALLYPVLLGRDRIVLDKVQQERFGTSKVPRMPVDLWSFQLYL